MNGIERRQHPRTGIEIACKIRCPGSNRTHQAVTGDLSAGGLLITVRAALPLAEGQIVDVALPTRPGSLVLARDMIRARIVRSSSMLSGHQVLALQFDEPQHAIASPAAAAA